MIRTQFNNQPKFAVLELRMGRHMNLFDRRVVLSVTNTAYTNSVIVADDEVPPGYRCYIWGARMHTNATLANSNQSLLTTNGTTLFNFLLNSVVVASSLDMMAESSTLVTTATASQASAGSTVNTGEFADDGYGLLFSVARNSNPGPTATVTVRVWGCVAPAQLTTAQWLAGAGGAGSGTGGGNDQQIR